MAAARTLLRLLAFLIAGPVLLAGALATVRWLAPGAGLDAPLASLLQTVSGLPGGALLEDVAGLSGPLALAPITVAAILVVFALMRGREPMPTVAKSAGLPASLMPQEADRRSRRRAKKQADALAKSGSPLEAAELLVDAGQLDRAVELFVAAGQLVRAAEIRHDQNRFLESAELYAQAGKHDTAGQILATQGDPARAADCFLKGGRVSLAAEMFEKAGDFVRAGEGYLEAGFPRHAAQAFVKAQAWGRAASALETVMSEEFSRAGGQDTRRQKELRTLVLQAGKLWDQAGQLDRAQAALERGGCFAAAAEMALRGKRHAQAAELFLRAQDPLRAAESLRALGEDGEAARILGEWHRDRGEDEEAARSFEAAGELGAAGDLWRKLERHEQAGSCYERHGDMALAADMYAQANDLVRAAACYERAGRFSEAASCFGSLGDRTRQAELLERAGENLRAADLLHELGRTDDAIKVLQRVAPGSLEHTEASARLGTIFRARGQHSLAVKKLQQAIGDAPLDRDNVVAYQTLAEALEEAGQLAEAIEIFEKILAFDYHHADVARRLAVAREKLSALPISDGGTGLATTGAPRGGTGVATTPGRYEIVGELGRGGMGIVYKARDTVLDRIVAFKVLPDALRESLQALKNFLREAKSAAQLNHPNIVTVYDAGEQDGRTYIAMEWVDGTTLKEIVKRRGAIAPSGVAHVLAQMCEGLAYAHDKKIVHRDIKTANTMWTRDRKAKIMDFGLAKIIEEVRNHTTLVSGTPYYMSPEQTLGRSVDHRADLYSLGVTLFELATGTLPFREGNVPYHHVHTPAPDPRSINPNLPEPLARIILRCLQKSPDDRYGSAREILAELRAAVADGSLKARPA